MAVYSFETVDVFTDQRFGGNPLAVFLDAQGISDREMQRLAAEMNLSETTFVLPPAEGSNTARVRIFNRNHEMPFAGHPLVGTAYVLARRMKDAGDALRFEVPAGLVLVRLIRNHAAVQGAIIEAPQPLTLGVTVPAHEIAESVGVPATEILVSSHAPTLASVGNTYVISEVTESGLNQASPNLAVFRRILDATPRLDGRFSLYLYTRADRAISARMFAPIVGTWEDPATGSAATPLAAVLLSLSGRNREEFTTHQGRANGATEPARDRGVAGAGGDSRQRGGEVCADVTGGIRTLAPRNVAG